MTEACVSFKRIVTGAANGLYWHEYYLTATAMLELVPPDFIEAFLTTYTVEDETDGVRKVLDSFQSDARVKTVFYCQGEAPGTWKSGGHDQPVHKAEGAHVVPFPPGLHVIMQYTAVLALSE